jgi:protein-S-isoprenylcysteine O-methyltransferase Ste14
MSSLTPGVSIAGPNRTAWHQVEEWAAQRRVSLSFAGLMLVAVGQFRFGAPWTGPSTETAVAGLGLALTAAGLGVRTLAAGFLDKGRGLATAGPYAVMRHPLYAGSALMAGGGLVLGGAPAAFWVAAMVIAGVYALTLRREERKLAWRYGEAWKAYAERTPMLVPRVAPSGAGWSAVLWRRNREYRAAGATLALVAAWAGWLALGQ